MTEKRFAVAEIFGPTIQGEGLLVGSPSVFVRFGGCDYRCRWCDSAHAVLPEYRSTWAKLTTAEIFADVQHRAHSTPLLIVLSGGNPALFDLDLLLRLGTQVGYRFSCETQGTRWPAWFSALALLTLSPKPPSSGESPDLPSFTRGLASAVGLGVVCEVKVPIFDDADLDWFATLRAAITQEFGAAVPLMLSVGNPLYGLGIATPHATGILRGSLLDRWRWLAEQVLARRWFDVRVLPQLHVLAYGNLRGV